MKKTLFTLSLLAVSLTSCDEITDVVNSVRVPDEAKPSKSFTLAQLPDETHVADAHRFVTSQSGAPFTAIEFFADGHYIMTNGKAARATEADVYGLYNTDGTLHYILENGDVVDASGLDSPHGTVTYTPKDGETVSVSVVSESPLVSAASKCFCRTWGLEHSKYWLSVKGFMALRRDYYMENGTLKHDDNKVADFIGEFYSGDLMTPNRWPEIITISPYGTYFVKFASGKTLLQEWSWDDEGKGTIKTASNSDFSITDFLAMRNVTIRFNDDKVTFYTNYEISGTRIDNANTFAPVESSMLNSKPL